MRRRTHGLLWAGLALLILQWGVFLRLTFFELSWDVMEPISYFFSSLWGIMAYAYFMVRLRVFFGLPVCLFRQPRHVLMSKSAHCAAVSCGMMRSMQWANAVHAATRLLMASAQSNQTVLLTTCKCDACARSRRRTLRSGTATASSTRPSRRGFPQALISCMQLLLFCTYPAAVHACAA